MGIPQQWCCLSKYRSWTFQLRPGLGVENSLWIRYRSQSNKIVCHWVTRNWSPYELKAIEISDTTACNLCIVTGDCCYLKYIPFEIIGHGVAVSFVFGVMRPHSAMVCWGSIRLSMQSYTGYTISVFQSRVKLSVAWVASLNTAPMCKLLGGVVRFRAGPKVWKLRPFIR